MLEGLRYAIAIGDLALQPLSLALGLTALRFVMSIVYFQYALYQAKKRSLLTRFETA